MKLFTVTLVAEMVVLAEDAAAAERVAKDHCRDVDVEIDSTKPMGVLPSGWSVDDYPYAATRPDSIAHLVSDGAAPEYVAARDRAREMLARLSAPRTSSRTTSIAPTAAQNGEPPSECDQCSGEGYHSGGEYMCLHCAGTGRAARYGKELV